MKLIFAGTPEFAAVALDAILDAGHEVALVLTQPDRPAGRGMALHASPVKQLALTHGIPVFQPATLKDAATQDTIRAVGAEVMVVAAYGLILPQAVLDMPRFGCLNIHGSLLPRWRGAAPIQRALLAGDDETGICIMQMEAGLDTGPVLLSEATAITAGDTAGSLHDRLATLGGRLVVAALARLPLPARTQPEIGVSYAAKIDKAESLIDWSGSAAEIDRHIRAFNPFPGASTTLDGVPIKIWSATPVPGASQSGVAGEVLAANREGILIGCGEGAVLVCELQKAGSKRLPAAQFLAGTAIAPGARFCPAT